MQSWLSRLTFSFLIIAAVLVWEIYKIIHSQTPPQIGRVILYAIIAGICLALAAAGMQARHRE
ncbi:MAG TPA: hypothetical protein VKK61_02540 [Tepidisphaeraceae bacterium]|nr:hypothetical protein [Tepidisphaeraceae bacterium]